MAFRSAAAYRRPRTEARGDESLRLQSVESGVDGARRDLAVQTRLHVLENSAPVRFLSEFRARANQREQHGLFESAQVFSQSVYIVDMFRPVSNLQSSGRLTPRHCDP